jgi:peptidoglycan/xylan/chitin deacetylase (PgdA/CDA1 family)
VVKLRDIWQTLYPYGVFRTGKAVYLTFDDGPIPEVTPKVLAVLAHYKVKATFFMVGENVDKHPEVYEQVVKAGHRIGNHTYNHIKGWHCTTATYLGNVEQCQERIGDTNLFRPPYGKATWLQRRMLHLMGYKLIYWDILTRDYDKHVTPEQMLRLIQRETREGSIINFHDSLKSNERMLEVLPKAIEWLQKEGYELATL